MLTRREAATVVAALAYWDVYGHPVKVRVPAQFGREVPLSRDETQALIVRLTNGEDQEDEIGSWKAIARHLRYCRTRDASCADCRRAYAALAGVT